MTQHPKGAELFAEYDKADAALTDACRCRDAHDSGVNVRQLAKRKQAARNAIIALIDDPVRAAGPELLAAAKDALSGWQYIRANHGDLYGVGWDRVEQSLSAAIAKAKAPADAEGGER